MNNGKLTTSNLRFYKSRGRTHPSGTMPDKEMIMDNTGCALRQKRKQDDSGNSGCLLGLVELIAEIIAGIFTCFGS